MIFADAVEEAGLPILAAKIRAGEGDHAVSGLSGGNPEYWLEVYRKNELEAAEKIEADRIKARNEACLFFGCGVTGCFRTLTDLAKRITRKRPRGSGSKTDLAKRLEKLLNKRADQRWERACKGQRKPTAKQAAELRSRIEAAVSAANGTCRERLIDAVEACGTAAKAISGKFATSGSFSVANSYGYSWTQTTAYGRREPNGEIKLTISRSGSREQVVIAPAKWFAAIAGG